jgi:transcriptional regulator with XRE-family HTH domain
MATLRQLRKQRHLTQEQLAVSADVSPSTVYHIEAGKVRLRPSILRRLARALGVDPSEIGIAAADARVPMDPRERGTCE